jgi:coenzyme Q-binding protein COQ10
LDNHWKFKDIEGGKCEVSFLLDYELRSKMLAMAAGAVFDIAFGKFVDAFEKRADEVYA